MVPDVLGMARTAAEASITAAGLTVGTVTEQNHDTVAVGGVVSQSPQAGARVATDFAVDLVVSLGPDGADGEGEGESQSPQLSLSTMEVMIVLPQTTGSFSVGNSGGGTLHWQITSMMPWAVCMPASGENDANITVTIDTTQLVATDVENQAVLTITGENGSTLLLVRVMPVGTAVEGEGEGEGEGDPWLWTNLNEVIVPQGNEGSLLLYNNGGGTLTWSIADLPPWLQADPMSASAETTTVRLTANPALLARGMNTADFQVTSNGGALTISVKSIGYDTTADYSIGEYWPLAEGNAWTWVRGGDFFTVEVTGFQTHSSGLPAWTVNISDTVGYWSTVYFTIYDETLCVAKSLDDLNDPDGLLYGDSCWDGTCSFPMYTAALTPGWGQSYLNNHSDVPIVPGTLSGLLAQWNIYESSYTLSDFSDFGDPADCLAFVQNHQTPEEVYTLFARGVGPLVWDAWRLTHAKVGTQEWGDAPGEGIAASGESDGLLYFSRQSDGSALYYSGTGGQVRMVVHSLPASGEKYAVLFGEDYLVSSWMLDRLVTAMYRIPAVGETEFDANNAYHFIQQEGIESEATFDIQPGALVETATAIAATSGDNAQPLFDFITTSGVTQWEDLVVLANTPGPDQSRYVLTALAFSAAHSLANMPLTQPKAITTLYFDLGVGVAKALWNDAILNKICPHCPTPGEPYYEVVICQGSSGLFIGSIEICYYFFMPIHPLTDCTDVCKASLNCFTSICASTQLDAQNAALWPRVGGPIIKTLPESMRKPPGRGTAPPVFRAGH